MGRIKWNVTAAGVDGVDTAGGHYTIRAVRSPVLHTKRFQLREPDASGEAVCEVAYLGVSVKEMQKSAERGAP